MSCSKRMESALWFDKKQTMPMSDTRKIILLTTLLLIGCIGSTGQIPRKTIRGVVIDDKSSEPMAGAVITLHSVSDDGILGVVLAYTTSGVDGTFSLRLPETNVEISCRVKFIGYMEQVVPISSLTDTKPLTIRLKESADTLPEVEVLGPPIQSRGDTVTYRASAFITPNTYSAEDLIKKLPGVTVDSKGIIKYMGEGIQGVYIEGLDLVADNYRTATRIVKANDIKEIDIMERFQKVKLLRGIKEGEGAMLNIKLKNKDMLRPSGDIRIGAGALDKNSTLSAGANTLLINSHTQILSSADVGNTNEQPIYSMGEAQNTSSTTVRRLSSLKIPSSDPSPLSLHQRRGGFTVNQIIPFGEDSSIKYNLGYQYQKLHRNGGQTAKLYNGTDYTIFDDTWEHSTRSHLAFITLDYTQNGSTHYTKNRLNIQGDHLIGHNDILRQYNSIHETRRGGEVRISNDFHLMQKYGNDVLKLNGYLNYRRSPRVHIGVPNGPIRYEQTFHGDEVTGRSSFTYGWGIGGAYSIDGSISVIGNYRSGEIRSNTDDILLSRASGTDFICSTAPALRYISDRLKWSLSIPVDVQWNNIDYLDFEKQDQHHRHLYGAPGVSFSLSFRPRSSLYMKLMSSYRSKYRSDFSDYFLGSYHTSFERIVTRNQLLIQKTSSINGSLAVEYRRPIRGFFGRLNIGGSRRNRNIITNSIIHGTTKESENIEGESTTNSVMGQLYLSQKVNALNSLVTLSIDYNYVDRPLMLLRQLSKMSIQSLSPNIALNSYIGTWMELNTAIRYATTRLRNVYSDSRVDNLSVTSGLTFNISQHISTVISNDSYMMIQDRNRYPTKSLFNASVFFRQPRYQVEVRCENLSDERRFYTYRNSDADERIRYDTLRPRQILAIFTYKF